MCQREAGWPPFCAGLGRSALADDPRFRTLRDRLAKRATLIPILEECFLQRTAAEWVEALHAAGIPAERINTVEEALKEPQVLARDMIVEVDHPRFGRIREIAPAIKIDRGGPPLRPAPALGQDTETILRDYLGKTSDEIAALRAAGAV